MRLLKTLFRVLVRLVAVPLLLVLLLIVGFCGLVVFALWPLMFEGRIPDVFNYFVDNSMTINKHEADTGNS